MHIFTHITQAQQNKIKTNLYNTEQHDITRQSTGFTESGRQTRYLKKSSKASKHKTNLNTNSSQVLQSLHIKKQQIKA